MTDIMFSYPTHCSDCDCWHQYNVWSNDDGTYSECDRDGDHTELDDIEYDALWREHDARWLAYAQDVLVTGKDPLGNYLVKPTLKRPVVYKIDVSPATPGGAPVLRRFQQNYRAWFFPGEWEQLPAELREYLNLQAGEVLGDFNTWQEFLTVVINKPGSGRLLPNGYARVAFTLEISYPNPRYKRELRRVVKDDIKRLTANQAIQAAEVTK